MKRGLCVFVAVMFTVCAWSSAWAGGSDIKKMDLGFWGGYTTAGMSDVNGAIKDAASGGSITETKEGILTGADLLFKIIPNAPKLSIGPRVEYLFISSAKLSQDTPLLNIKEDFYVVPVMIGGRYALMEKSDWALTAALFLGVGIGYGKSTVTTAADPTNATITKYSGSDLTELLMIGGRYKIGQNTFFGVDLGYRQLRISQMNIDSTSVSSLSGGGGGGSYSYAPSRAPVTDSTTGDKIMYDFSGMVFNIGINFMF